MKNLKLIIRILITTVFFIPSFPIIFLYNAMFGILLYVPVLGIIELLQSIIKGEEKKAKSGLSKMLFPLLLLSSPFIFWYRFLLKRKLFIEQHTIITYFPEALKKYQDL